MTFIGIIEEIDRMCIDKIRCNIGIGDSPVVYILHDGSKVEITAPLKQLDSDAN